MGASGRIKWVRALAGGFLAELSVFVVVIPILLLWGQHPILYVAPVASLAACFLFAIWVGRKVDSQFVLHGILVGVVATLLYVGLTRGQPEPMAYIFAHILKILGGAAGGFVAAGRRKPISASAVEVRWGRGLQLLATLLAVNLLYTGLSVSPVWSHARRCVPSLDGRVHSAAEEEGKPPVKGAGV